MPSHEDVIDGLSLQDELGLEDALDGESAGVVQLSSRDIRPQHTQCQLPGTPPPSLSLGLLHEASANALSLVRWVYR